MFAQTKEAAGPVRTLWQWGMDQLVQDVPNGIAVCEFDCRRTDCTLHDWAACDRRKRFIKHTSVRNRAPVTRFTAASLRSSR